MNHSIPEDLILIRDFRGQPVWIRLFQATLTRRQTYTKIHRKSRRDKNAIAGIHGLVF